MKSLVQRGGAYLNGNFIGSKILIYIFWFIYFFNVSQVSCCMPGYEIERAKLRQYLGIEWTPNGLEKMKGKKIKPVRHPNELNCDFTNPELCRWENLNVLDTLDFHLFQKEDNIEFPMIQVRPGPSKVAVGDKLIFVGDKKKKEQSAILASWPIRCQNSTGRLTFTFWIYNGANIEVLIIEENAKTRDLHISREKQHVNCGTVTVNTECSVEIPARETPFRIGIRAYDIKNPDGSFVLIDNIYYEAQFCKVSVDFGSDFVTEELMTAEEGELVQASSQLTCHNFDSHCRWRNAGNNKKEVWQRGMTSPPNGVMFNETGTYTTPTAPFAFMYIEEEISFPDYLTAMSPPKSITTLNDISENEKRKGQRLLVSDPILCQSPTNPAIISFRIWATKGVNMSICAMDLKFRNLECQMISMARSPAPVYHQFSVREKFIYAFRIEKVNSDFDNFVIIDDIDYRATMCSEALNTLDLGADFYTTPMLSTLLHRHVHSASDLSCDFSRRALNCRWANLEDESLGESGNSATLDFKDENGSTFFFNDPKNADTNWEIGLGRIDEVKFASLTNLQTTPESDLAIARLMWQNSTAILVSETIRCLTDVMSTLTLRYWRTGGAALSVCVINSFSFEAIDCQRISHLTGYAPGRNNMNTETDKIVVEIPRFNEPIRIALRAEAVESVGVIAVDDITFEGRICSKAAYSSNSHFGFKEISLLTMNGVNSPSDDQPQRSTFALHGLKILNDNNKKLPFKFDDATQTDKASANIYDAFQSDEHKEGTQAHVAPDENVCRLLSCDFNAAHMCLYTSTKIASRASMFRPINQSAHVMLFEHGRVAVLESIKFDLNTAARLHFDFAIQKGVAHLHVCQDSVEQELDSCFIVDNTKKEIGQNGLAVHDFVELLPTDTKLYIIAKLDKQSQRASIWLDNIVLTDVENHRIC